MSFIKNALNDFYYSTSGSSWINNTNWLNYNLSYSSWYGMTANDKNDIISLNLFENNLHGTLPTSISHITTLTEISLDSNYLSGSIPSSLLTLNELDTFTVSFNYLTGQVEDFCFKNLIHLDLSYNHIQGQIPDCLSYMTNLKIAVLECLHLSGPLPNTISVLINIEELYLDENLLSGELPIGFSYLSNMKILNIKSNLFEGQFRNLFYTWDNLIYLNIEHNLFTGTFPIFLLNLTSIMNLDANDNFFSGTLTNYINSNISKLQINQNLLTGSVSVLSIDDFRISNNYFTGSVPNLFNLEYFHSSYNYFSGSLLNSSFGKCGDLQLDNNYIYGSLPEISEYPYIVYLQNNLLSGSISTNDWIRMGFSSYFLVYVRLDHNFLTGQLSSSFSIDDYNNHPYFHTLILSNNFFTGPLNKMICRIDFFNFQISNNLLTGPSCDDFSFWTGYEDYGITYTIADNFFTGSILGNFYDCSSLYKVEVIDLSGNFFSEQLNNFNFDNAKRLLQLQLGYNLLSGTIPERIANMTSLTSFSLGGNLLSGTIPSSFSQLTDMKLLDITGLQMCYSIDLARAVLGYSSGNLYRCQDMQDIAICSLRYQSSIYDTISITDNEITLFYESKHLYEPDTDIYEYVYIPNAYYFTIVFDDWSELELDYSDTDYIQFCADSRCSVTYSGKYKGTSFPGMNGIDALVIQSDSFYIHFKSDSAVQHWGYAFNAKAVISRVGWTCGTPPDISLPLSHDILQSYNLSSSQSYAIDFCGNNEQWEGISCSYGMVQKLSFGSYGIPGSIPSVISLLTFLEDIDFKYNSLTGTIPSSLGNLTNLKVLDFSNNKISGTIPSDIGNLPKIEEIYLFSNKLSGKLPESLYNLNESLDKLYLSANELTGKLESSLCSLKNTTIDISGNSMDCYESCWSSATSLKTNIQECYPTSYPTSQPTSPTIAPTKMENFGLNYQYFGLITALGVVLVIACSLLIYWWTRAKYRKEMFIRNSILDKLPIHRYIINNQSPDVIVKMIKYSSNTISKRDYEGKSVIDLAIEHNFDNKIIFEILKQLLLMIKEDSLLSKDFIYAWTRVVQFDIYLDSVNYILDEFHQFNRQMSECVDENGRLAVNIASPLCRKAIKESLYFLRRYDFGSSNYPTHVSETSVVYIVIDTQADIMGNNKVALKFISDKECYMNEIESRSIISVTDNNHVVPILYSYDSETNSHYNHEIVKRNLSKYPYCIVMPACDKTLGNIITTERIAGKDWFQLQAITSKLSKGIEQLHSQGYVHGDLKPLNVVRMGEDIKLIDLDNSVSIGLENSNKKYSEAYLPPEMLFKDYNSNKIFVKSTDNNRVIQADYSQDCWAFGMLLYELFTGMSFFPKDDEDKIDDDSLQILYDFNEEMKIKKLLKISNKFARNLVSLLLIKDPSKRLSISRVLEHPFITNKPSPRLVGEEPEYDVFLSYRVNSDFEHAQIIYDLLTSEGIKVWWDKKSLSPGMNWENGFSDGLVKSKILVPIISKNCLNHPSDYRSNVTYLNEYSPCDNVILEYEMALEFHERGLLSYVYPILIGDYDDLNHEYVDYFMCGSYPSGVSNCEVKSIDEKVCDHLNRLGLGSRMITNKGIKSILDKIFKSQGLIVKGSKQIAFQPIVNDMKLMKL